MAVTGPLYPTVGTDGGGPVVWANPGYITADDGSSAHASYFLDSMSRPSPSNALIGSGFGFHIPSTAVINGIYLEVKRSGDQAEDLSIQLLQPGPGGSPMGILSAITYPGSTGASSSNLSTSAFVPSSAGYIGYGGATNLWGLTWTPAQINSPNFAASVIYGETHDPADTNVYVDTMRITVYWQAGPQNVEKRYLYQVTDSLGNFLGTLPTPTTDFQFSQDINTAGSQLTIDLPVSIDTSALANTTILDESSGTIEDESSNPILSEGQPPIVALGTTTNGALVKNGNIVTVIEIGYWNPNGKVVFVGEIQRWEASFGGSGGGSGGAAQSDFGADAIMVLVYSLGVDLSQYPVRGYPYTFTADQVQASQDQAGTLLTDGGDKGVGYQQYAQSITIGSGVTNVGAINLMLYGAANVSVTFYDGPDMATILGSIDQAVNVGPNTVVQFAFPTNIPVTPAATYFFTVACDAGDSIYIYYDDANPYSGGEMYYASYGGGGGGSFGAVPGSDLYFETFSGTGSTQATFTSLDPSTGILEAIMNDYIARGGLIGYNSSTITATGLSITYGFNTNTVYEALQSMLAVAPNGFYYYVDLATNTLYFKQANEAADVVFTKDRHLDQITIIATIESIINSVLFTGGVPTGDTTNLYTSDIDATSVALYGPRLDRPADNSVVDTGTADAITSSEIAENSSEQYQTTITVVDQTMDTTTLKPGMTVGFNGFGTFVDSMLLQIVRVDYYPEEVTLTLGILPKRLQTNVEETVRSVLALQTIANPSTPS